MLDRAFFLWYSGGVKTIEAAILLDYYGPLLTDKQRRIMELFCNFDLTPSEIGEELGMTRQAAHEAVNKCCAALEEYEEKLGFRKRIEKIMHNS